MRLKVINERDHINLWLPLFLAWIIVGALALALSPLMALAVMIAWPFGWGEFMLMIGPAIYECLCHLRDLRVDVSRGREITLIYFK
jgi:hypothetical protein